MKKPVFLVVAALLVGGALFLFLFRASATNRTIVRNSTGTRINAVQLHVQDYGGTKTFSRNAEFLASGDSMVLRHDLNDFSVKLTYTLGGVSQKHVEDYVDLWSGQGWLIDVQPGGKIQSGYESVKND